MLRVAINGPIGSGKSTCLLDFAEAVQAGGLEVDGFTSIAGRRPTEDEGAEAYHLYWIKAKKSEPYVIRNDEGVAAMMPEAETAIQDWAKTIPSKQDLIVLDEMGKWESQGRGLISIWPKILTAKPRMVVVTLRKGVQAGVETQLGRPFDKVLDAEDPTTPKKLLEMVAELKDWENVGIFGASSGALECSLGSYLHAVRFPFTGTIMGSVQCATLTLASRNLARKELAVWVSTIAAGLKAMSPAGARLTPMVAIVVQGMLFTLGSWLGRWSKVGNIVGALLVGVWAALQGFFLQYLMLGRDLSRAWDRGAMFLRDMIGIKAPSIEVFVVLMAVTNGLFCILFSNIALAQLRKGKVDLRDQSSPRSIRSRILFWIPFVMVLAMMFFQNTPVNQTLWLIFRVAIVVTLVSCFGLLLKQVDLSRWLTKRGFWGPAVAVRTAQDKTK